MMKNTAKLIQGRCDEMDETSINSHPTMAEATATLTTLRPFNSAQTEAILSPIYESQS